MQEGTVFAIVDLFVRIVELPLQVGMADGANLLDPPILLFVAVDGGAASGEHHRLDFEGVVPFNAIRVEHTVGIDELPGGQQFGEPPRRIRIRLFQILREARIGCGCQNAFEFPAIRRADLHRAFGPVEVSHVPGNCV